MDPADLLADPSLPAVLRGGVAEWPAVRKWSAEFLAEEMLTVALQFRLGQRECRQLQWERDCPKVRATMLQLLEWLNTDTTGSDDSPFAGFPVEDYWAYADYMYVSSVLQDVPHILEDIEWELLSPDSSRPEPSLDAGQSSLWIGTCGAYTPCHYDTYGYNIVAQVRGHKTWVVFPPEDSARLYPTRVPMEESTVYSGVHVLHPDLRKFPAFGANIKPRAVTLGPGDVLYVPRHWWHSVRTEPEPADQGSPISISVNLWIDQPTLDNRERFKEAITSILWRSVDETFATMSVNDLTEPERQRTREWAGDESSSETFALLQRSFDGLTEAAVPEWATCEPPKKRSKLQWEPLPLLPLEELLPCPAGDARATPSRKARAERHSRRQLDVDTFLRAVTDPRVVEQIANIITQDS